MPKLVLINPNPAAYKLSRQGFRMQPLNLAYVAALTPPEWEVVLCDENMAPAEILPDADLVGITTLTATVNRAYELAAQYRRRGIPVVLGGIHVSMVPEEAERRADAVVIGEAEAVWAQVVEDARQKRLKPRYAGERTAFQRAILPRRDLLSARYTIGAIQTSRGCPFDCEFCSVKAFNGAAFRQRDVDDVLDELATIPQKTVFFTDDNLIGYSAASRERAKQIFRGMIARKLGKRWLCQTAINFADDPETLELAAQSGCALVLVGIESINEKVLKGTMGKEMNSRRGVGYYDEFIRQLHQRGIVIIGNMMFGNDEDGPTAFADTARFWERSGLDIPWPGLLTPYPGTQLAKRLAAEQRIVCAAFPGDWDKYNSTLVIALKNDSREAFFEKFRAFTQENYAYGKVLRRTLRTLCYSRSLPKALLVYSFNRSLARRFRLGIAPPAPPGDGASPTT
jgi:radical SAM superfamily enzyme YgiQ (UPF0313 family)